MMGHSRWTAAARELARHFWDTDPGFTLVMTSLGALGALFFRGGLVRKVVTAYSGNSFPTYTPNPVFRQAYESGEVEVEHWSILTLTQRLEAAARGLPAAVTGSLVGSSMAENDAFTVVDSPFGPLGLLEPLAPDVALVHAAAADPAGNLVFSEPLLDGVWGAWAARRGVVATVERVVDDLEGLGHRVRVPGHRVLAVVEAPYGAHPGGCYAPGLPVRSYGEDIALLERGRRRRGTRRARRLRRGVGARAGDPRGLPRRGWARSTCSGSKDAPTPCRGRPTPTPHPVVDDPVVTPLGAGRVASGPGRSSGWWPRSDADAVLAGAGVANLAAWVAVARARAAGSRVHLDGRARPVGLRADAGRPVHLQPAGLPRHAVPVRRLHRPRHGDRRPGDDARWGVWARPRSTGTGASTRPSWRAGGSWSARGVPTTWPAGPRPASW